jgi:hypothetical protein
MLLYFGLEIKGTKKTSIAPILRFCPACTTNLNWQSACIAQQREQREFIAQMMRSKNYKFKVVL